MQLFNETAFEQIPGQTAMGADGGMHFRGEAYSPGAARGWAEEKRRGLVRKIMAGDARFSVF